MITLLVPTLNHPDLIHRQLRYYADVGFPGAILIGDSSEGELAERTEEAVKKHQDKVDVTYVWCPKMHDTAAQQQLVKLVKTPYVIGSGDDDFYIPSVLQELVDFLSNNPEYGSVHGLASMAIVQPNGTGQNVLGTAYYPQQVSEAETASERLLHHYSHYSNVGYSLKRVESLQPMFGRAHEMERSFAGEVFSSCLLVVLGKVKELDCFYMVRQIHQDRHLLPQQFDWITTEQWLPSYRVYLDCMSEEIVKRDGISVEEAKETVKQAFSGFLARGMYRQWDYRYGQQLRSSRPGLRRAAGRIPGVRHTYQTVKSYMPGKQNAMSMEAFLRPGSRYHDAFMPAYRAMVDPL
jgi:glycosyltransferase domain-containing protein